MRNYKKGNKGMLKEKKNIGIIILIVVVITALIILISKVTLKNRYTQQTKNNILSNQEVSNDELEQREEANSGVTHEEIASRIDELSEVMKDKTDKCQVIVNGEEIS